MKLNVSFSLLAATLVSLAGLVSQAVPTGPGVGPQVPASLVFTNGTPSLPIGTKSALRSYAIEMIKSVGGSVYAQTILQRTGLKSSFWSEYTGQAGDLDAINQFASQPLQFALADPNDQLVFNLNYYSADGFQLFGGYNYFKLVWNDRSGKWIVPETALTLALKINDSVPLHIKGVLNIHVIGSGSDGRNVNVYISRDQYRGDVVNFPVAYAEIKGKVFVSSWDERTQTYLTSAYDIGNEGKLIPPTNAEGMATASIHNALSVVPNLAALTLDLTPINNHSPVVEWPVTVSGSLEVKVYAHVLDNTGHEIESATGGRYRTLNSNNPGTSGNWHEFGMTNGVYTPLVLPQGINHLIFDWATPEYNDDGEEHSVIIDNNDGGKG